MTVLLRRSASISRTDVFDEWLSIGNPNNIRASLPPERQVANGPALLEEAFVEIRDLYWELGRALSGQNTGNYSHAAACASFGSDFGVMLAWDRIVRGLAGDDGLKLVICDDPWLFRHLAQIPSVEAGKPPPIWLRRIRMFVRGNASRASAAIRMAQTAFRLRKQRNTVPADASSILVYGHPESDANGHDAYFGDLMKRYSDISRILHCDCNSERAVELAADGRTAALHAWGNPIFAVLRLPWVRWKPRLDTLSERFRWIVRRAADRENSGGAPAMIAWQIHCQRRWLDHAKPRAVAWPWENFSWERSLVRMARARDVPTIGYQHTVVGPHQFNYSVRANHDGQSSFPDIIAANGEKYSDELLAWGTPADRLEMVGAFRLRPPVRHPEFDPGAPVFMAMSGNLSFAEKQLAVAATIAASGRHVLVKNHPMYPVNFKETERIARTDRPLAEHTALSAVVYTTGAIALDAIFAHIPGIRLRYDDSISIDILPRGIRNPVSDAHGIVDLLGSPIEVPEVDWTDVFALPCHEKWAALLHVSQ